MNIKYLVIMFMFAAAAAAHAQEWDIGAGSFQRNSALAAGRVVEGVVVQARSVEVAPTATSNGVATGVGGLIGAALGSSVGGGKTRYAAGALGALLGGVAGNAVGQMINSATAQELIIKREDGGLVVIVQAESSLSAGQAVYLTEINGKVRAIPRQQPQGL